ncbi:MAG TPA: TolC family protein [Edaphocola sp.]|nr:TolC family protein [Edaphocola sp.]
MFKVFIITLLLVTCFLRVNGQDYNLQYYLKQGEANSPLLKDYKNRMRTGMVDSLLIKASNRPRVLANGQVLIAPAWHGYGFDPAVTNGGNYQAVIAFSQPIFNKYILRPEYRQIALQQQATRIHEQVSRLDMDKDITGQYITAYADYVQLALYKDVSDLLRKQQKILGVLVRNGIYKETDYLKLKVALQTQEISTSQVNAQYKTDIANLNLLCGISDTLPVILAEPQIQGTGYFSHKINSVFFEQFIIDSLNIQNARKVIDAKYKPFVSWFADVGLESSRPAPFHKNFGADFGVNLHIPIYDGQRRKIVYAKQEIDEATRCAYASSFNRQYVQQHAMLLQQLKESEKLIRAIKEKMKTTDLLISLEKEQLNTGDITITDYLLAVSNYLDTKNSLNREIANRWEILNQLNYLNN